MKVTIVHMLSTPDVGYSIFSTFSEVPDVVFCFTKISERPDGGFDGDISVIAETGKHISEETEKKAGEVVDFVFQETMKQIIAQAKQLSKE